MHYKAITRGKRKARASGARAKRGISTPIISQTLGKSIAFEWIYKK